MASYLSALGVLFQPMNFIMMYLCSLVGCVLGAIPGLSGGLGITLILPMTFALNTNLSFAMLLGMYVGGVSGSFIAAVLVGIPGSAASIGTCYDGYPMTQKGQAARALTIGITGSFIGTLVSIIVATICSTFIADVALMLGPWEYFSLCLMAITMVVGLSNGSIFKGLLAAFFGLWIGFLPGMGSGISNLIAYGQAKKMSKHPEKFGTGIDEGIWATEVANNAGVGGAIIPMIALGIPGDATTVLLMSAMTIHGLQAGPMFIKNNPLLANLIFATILVSAILIFVTELFTKRWFPMLLKAPYHYLYSAILMICFLGAYSASTSMFSVYLVLVFGAVGILMEFFKMPGTPLMLAFILGSKIESYFRMGCSYARGDMTSFVTRPISLIFILIAVYSVVGPIITKMLKKRKAAAN